jgi:hypothetical protein
MRKFLAIVAALSLLGAFTLAPQVFTGFKADAADLAVPKKGKAKAKPQKKQRYERSN